MLSVQLAAIEMNTFFAYYPCMESIYFDWAATAPILPELPQLISEALFTFQGNPSSIHSSGKKSRTELDYNRKVFAKLLETKPEQLIFTSGGSESNSIIFSSLFLKKPGSHIILSAIEHPSIYEFATNLKSFGYEIDFIKPAANGIIIPENIEKHLKKNTTLVSIMTVNNETGAIQKINGIGKLIRNFEQTNGRKIHFHTDAVQALGKIPFKPGLLNIDSASFSAHKIGGPKGVGMLFLKKPLNVISSGGGQEFTIRPGTENIAGIKAFARAMEISLEKLDINYKLVQSLKTILIDELKKIKGIKFLFDNNFESDYSPYIVNATVAPIPGEVVVRMLSDEGIQISTGSACSSRNSKKKLRVLTASGISEQEASGSIRISLGWSSTKEEILNFSLVLNTIISKLRIYHK